MYLRFLFCLQLVLFLSTAAFGQWLDDVQLAYSWNRISEVILGKSASQQTLQAEFIRRNAEVTMGKGPATLGFIYQVSTTDLPLPVDSDRGYMLTAGYDYLITRNLRAEAFGRLGLGSDSLDYSGIYANDTDFRLNLIGYTSGGFGHLAAKPIFPSLYIGAIINKYSRVQITGGAGIWWNGLGIYLTGHRALNGVADPANPGEDGDKIWANVENAAISVSLSYEYHNAKITVKRTHPFYNGGNDLVVAGQYLFYLKQ